MDFFPPGISYTLYLLVIKDICMILPFVKGCVDIPATDHYIPYSIREKVETILCSILLN